jgi:dTDP-4-amino-4,6-dideoxygalactose transaminase
MNGKKIRLSKASMSNEELFAVNNVIKKEFLGMGLEVKIFEDEIAGYINNINKKAICVNSGTAALHLAIEALGLSEGDEVLVPTITYVATFQAITAAGAVPIACDINANTLFIDPNDVLKKINKKTKAIVPVHYASSCKGIDEIYDISRSNSLRIIEDAAQSFGCLYKEKKIGFFGDITCFSFDGIKNITCGEGGAIYTDDEQILNFVKDARLLGVEKDTEQRYTNNRSWDFDVTCQGYRYHMSNINAAIGSVQLKRIEIFKRRRQKIVANYLNYLKNIREIEILDFDYYNLINHIFVIKVKKRDQLRIFLQECNIETGIHYKPNHLLKKFNTGLKLETAEKIYEAIISLPCHVDLTEDEQMYIIESVIKFYKRN